MTDDPDRTPGPDDPLIARLRRGLDRLTDDVGAEPPGLTDVPVTATAGDSGRRRWLAGAAAAALVAVVAGTAVVIATGEGGDDDPEMASLDSATAVADTVPVTTGPEAGSPDQLYRAVATVLDDGSPDGPQLCLGAIMESFPPQCGGLGITNWEWRGDLTFERASGVRWGEFVVVGTYDREAQTFTLTQPARDAASGDYTQGPNVDFSTPCEAPDTGWPEATNQELSDAAQQIGDVRSGPLGEGTGAPPPIIDGFGGLWIGSDPNVLNVRVVGDVDAADATIREVFDGPLCLIPSEYTLAELRDIQNSVDLGSNPAFSASYVDVERNVAVFETNAPDAELEAELEERFGDAAEVQVIGLIPIAPGEDPDPGPGTTPGTAGPVAQPLPATVPISAGPPASTAPARLDPDTPVSSPAVNASTDLAALDFELSVPGEVRAGDSFESRWRVTNRSGSPVTDRGCQVGGRRYGMAAAAEPDRVLWWTEPAIDCGGEFVIRNGYDDEGDGPTFDAITAGQAPLPSGEYLAVVEVDGYGRVEAPVTVTG